VLFWFVPISIFVVPLIEQLLGSDAPFVALDNPWRDVSVCGALFVAACWLAGYFVRGRRCRQPSSLPSWINITILAFAIGATLPLSTYGWMVIHDPEHIPSDSVCVAAEVLFVFVLPSVPVLVLARDALSSRRRRSPRW
jgi:hypothetical protein